MYKAIGLASGTKPVGEQGGIAASRTVVYAVTDLRRGTSYAAFILGTTFPE
jgi:hypothetical protein